MLIDIYENLIRIAFTNRLLVVMKLNELFNLSGKIALVTGCSRGIGKAMALGLGEAGADIIGVSLSLESGSDIEKEIIGFGRNFRPYKINLENKNDLYESIGKIKSHIR